MVRMVRLMTHEPPPSTRVWAAWGPDRRIQAEVDHVYGPPDNRHALLWLDPTFSGELISERATISMPLSALEPVIPAA